MPYFTRQVAPNGALIVVSLIGVSQAKRSALIAANRPIPSAVSIQGLIDTGASGTCIDPSVLAQLGLTPTGSTLMNTPTTGTNPVLTDTYDVSLTIYAAGNQPPLLHQTVPVCAVELAAAQGFHALVGRDILKGCLFTYDGVNGLFSLAY